MVPGSLSPPLLSPATLFSRSPNRSLALMRTNPEKRLPSNPANEATRKKQIPFSQ
jgi:hypothetical protein